MGRKQGIALVSLVLFLHTDLLASLDPQFAGIPQRDGALKFTLPDSMHAAVGHPSCDCDAQWDVDNVTLAIITKDGITFDPPVKEVTHISMTTDRCSSIVRYFVDCLETQFKRDIIYTCVTSTQSPPQPPEVKEATGSSQFQETTPGRNHDGLIIAVCLFIVVCLSTYLLVTYWNSTRL